MKFSKAAIAFISSTLLAGCVTQSGGVKENSGPEVLNKDYLACRDQTTMSVLMSSMGDPVRWKSYVLSRIAAGDCRFFEKGNTVVDVQRSQYGGRGLLALTDPATKNLYWVFDPPTGL